MILFVPKFVKKLSYFQSLECCKANKDFYDSVNLNRSKILSILAKVAFLRKRKITFFYFPHFSGLWVVFVRLCTTESNKKVSIAHLISAEIHFELFHGKQKTAAIFPDFYFGSDRENIKNYWLSETIQHQKNCIFTSPWGGEKKGIVGSGVFIQILFCFVLSACSWWCFMYSQAVDPASRW